MANTCGNAYALTVLAPIQNGCMGEISHAEIIRNRLQGLPSHEKSPLAQVPNTYLARLFILDDVFYQGNTANDALFNFGDLLSFFSDRFRQAALPCKDNLRSKYLVFTSDFHGDLDVYLEGLWKHWVVLEKDERRDVRHLWEYCVGFEQVTDSTSFIRYIKECQLNTTLYFNGSTDDSLKEQLKSLYLKQEFARFAVEHQGKSATQLQTAFMQFIDKVQPENLAGPSWAPGQSSL